MKMHYKMAVDIFDTKTPEGMYSGLHFDMDCYFHKDEDDYGNGWYVFLVNNSSQSEKYIDLRYNRSFRAAKADEWLRDWAERYWSGENGAWKVKSLEITKVSES